MKSTLSILKLYIEHYIHVSKDTQPEYAVSIVIINILSVHAYLKYKYITIYLSKSLKHVTINQCILVSASSI